MPVRVVVGQFGRQIFGELTARIDVVLRQPVKRRPPPLDSRIDQIEQLGRTQRIGQQIPGECNIDGGVDARL